MPSEYVPVALKQFVFDRAQETANIVGAKQNLLLTR